MIFCKGHGFTPFVAAALHFIAKGKSSNEALDLYRGVKLLEETLPKLVKDSSKDVCLAAGKQILAVSQHIQSRMDAGSLTECAGYLTEYAVLRPLLQHGLIAHSLCLHCIADPLLCRPAVSVVS